MLRKNLLHERQAGRRMNPDNSLHDLAQVDITGGTVPCKNLVSPAVIHL